MAISDILANIDCDIAKLQQARALLSGNVVPKTKKKAGRPKKAAKLLKKAAIAASITAKPTKEKKRVLSPEGKKRIAEAAKKRWAAKRAAGTK
jgi:hypothetical protein